MPAPGRANKPAAHGRRLGSSRAGVRERVENLYFAYLFVLRATLKAAPLLEDIVYDTGFPEEDARTGELVRKLVSHCKPSTMPPRWCKTVLFFLLPNQHERRMMQGSSSLRIGVAWGH